MIDRLLKYSALCIFLSISGPSYATNISTADPNYPQAYEDIDSEPLREQFNKFINDIDNLWAAIGPNFLEANQILGALVSGKAQALPMPSCFGLTNALTWRPGLGFGCNDIEGGGGGSLSPANPFTVLAGPSGGSPAIPTAIQLTGNYLPLPSANSIGGVQSASAAAHQFMNGISTSGVPLFATPSFADISGSLNPAQLPTPTTSSLGGVQSISAVPHNFLTTISTSGVPAQAQPSFGDISGNIGVSQIASGSGATSSTFLRGDGTWAVPSGSGTVNSGTSGMLAYYATTGTAVSPLLVGPNIGIINSSLSFSQPSDRNVTGSTDTISANDCGGTIVYSASGAVAISVAAASSAGLTQGCGFTLNNKGAAAVTITPTTSLINGQSSFLIPPGTGCYIRSNSTNYLPDLSACSALTTPAGTLATTPADNATCTPGQQWWDTSFIYLCTASGTVKRAALSTF